MAALGLLVSAFSDHKTPLTHKDRLTDLAGGFVGQNGLLFDSFFITALIALGLHKTKGGCPAEVEEAISSAIMSDLDVLRNDPKNLLAGFWWAQATGHRELSDRIVRCADELFRQGAEHLDERVSCALILVEALDSYKEQERLEIASFARDAIKSASFEAADSGVLRNDVLPLDDDDRVVGTVPISRILVSFALLCDDLLTRKAALLLPKPDRRLQIIRGTVYASVCFFMISLLIWVGCHFRPAQNVATIAANPAFLMVMKTVGLWIGYVIFSALIVSFAVTVYFLIFGLAITGRLKDEADAFREATGVIRDKLVAQVTVSLCLAVVWAILTQPPK